MTNNTKEEETKKADSSSSSSSSTLLQLANEKKQTTDKDDGRIFPHDTNDNHDETGNASVSMTPAWKRPSLEQTTTVATTTTTTTTTTVPHEEKDTTTTHDIVVHKTECKIAAPAAVVVRATVTPDPQQPPPRYEEKQQEEEEEEEEERNFGLGLVSPPTEASPLAAVASPPCSNDNQHGVAAMTTATTAQEEADLLLAQSLFQQELEEQAKSGEAGKGYDGGYTFAEVESFYRPILALVWPEVYFPRKDDGPQRKPAPKPPGVATAAAATTTTTMEDVMPPPPNVKEIIRVNEEIHQKATRNNNNNNNNNEDQDWFIAPPLPHEMRSMLFTGSIMPFLEFLSVNENLTHTTWDELDIFANDNDQVYEIDWWDTKPRKLRFLFVCKYLELYGENCLIQLLANHKDMMQGQQHYNDTAFAELSHAVVQGIHANTLQGNGDSSSLWDVKMPAVPTQTHQDDYHDNTDDHDDPELAAAIALSLADAAIADKDKASSKPTNNGRASDDDNYNKDAKPKAGDTKQFAIQHDHDNGSMDDDLDLAVALAMSMAETATCAGKDWQDKATQQRGESDDKDVKAKASNDAVTRSGEKRTASVAWGDDANTTTKSCGANHP